MSLLMDVARSLQDRMDKSTGTVQPLSGTLFCIATNMRVSEVAVLGETPCICMN